MADSLNKRIAEERAFIHALANPLAGMELYTETIIDDLKEIKDLPEDLLTRVEAIKKSMEQMRTILQDRRQTLIAGSTLEAEK